MMTISRRQLFRLSGAGAAASLCLPSIGAAESSSRSPSPNNLLHPVQALDTSGARAVAPFELDGKIYLAIPQLAQEIDGQRAHMNGGDCDVSLIVYRHQPGGFVEYQRLPVSGGEDAEFFRIGNRAFWRRQAYAPGAARIHSMSIQRSSNGVAGGSSDFKPFPRLPRSSGGTSRSASGLSSRWRRAFRSTM
jgi:hypothetical protein